MSRVFQIIRVWWLIRIAKKRASKKGLVQFVMKWNGKIRIMDFDSLKEYFHPGYLHMPSTIDKFKKASFYYTKYNDDKERV